jgi:hypothetical protein
MDSRSQLDEHPARISNGTHADREERLLRLVDILRTEQMRASVVEPDDAAKKTNPRWRSIGLILAIAVLVIAAGVTVLRVADPFHIHPASPPKPLGKLAPVQPATGSDLSGKSVDPANARQAQPHEGLSETGPATNAPSANRQVPESLPSGTPQAAPSGQSVANPPNGAEAVAPPAAVTARPNPVGALAPEHKADVVADPQSALAEQEAAEPATAKPVLRVYYPKGSMHAEVSAWSLSVRSRSDIASSDFRLQTNASGDALVKFSDERNHAVARLIGKYLGDAGYSWKIVNTTGSADSQRNIVEVWLPTK